MKLSDLLSFDDIVIQCHDNPDADALAAGFAIKTYLDNMGKNSRFIYRGLNKIQKSNLLIMIDELKIPVSFEPDFAEIPELLVLVDCQYGQRNTTVTEAGDIAVIDHHQICTALPELSEVRSRIGSCSTVVWSMLCDEGFEVNMFPDLATALYYGLYMDSNRLSEVSHPLDRDMQDSLIYHTSVINLMCNSNLSLEEFQITGKAVLNSLYMEDTGTLLIQADPCDPCILGIISDFSLEVDKVNVCVAFFASDIEIKFSIRSCSREVLANELADFLAKDVGGGGGHTRKAGGTIYPELIDCSGEELIISRIKEYYTRYSVIDATETTLDTSDMSQFKPTDQVLGTVRMADMWEVGSEVEIRTMDGDIHVLVNDDTYLMIGIDGEIYPILEDKLHQKFDMLPFKYSRDYEYPPTVRNVRTGKKKHVLPFAKLCRTKANVRIYARQIEQAVKLFTCWDEDKYYTADPGDYIAVSIDDPHDISIINKELFDRMYKPV